MNKKAQEEMVGFALIIVIVAVIIVVFISFSLRNPQTEAVESYKVEGFLQSTLQYTTDCKDSRSEYLTVKNLVFECESSQKCLDNRDSCVVLENTLKEISEESWFISEGSSVKGYELTVNSQAENLINITDGNRTLNSKGAHQPFSKSGGASVDIQFVAYY